MTGAHLYGRIHVSIYSCNVCRRCKTRIWSWGCDLVEVVIWSRVEIVREKLRCIDSGCGVT